MWPTILQILAIASSVLVIIPNFLSISHVNTRAMPGNFLEVCGLPWEPSSAVVPPWTGEDAGFGGWSLSSEVFFDPKGSHRRLSGPLAPFVDNQNSYGVHPPPPVSLDGCCHLEDRESRGESSLLRTPPSLWLLTLPWLCSRWALTLRSRLPALSLQGRQMHLGPQGYAASVGGTEEREGRTLAGFISKGWCSTQFCAPLRNNISALLIWRTRALFWSVS